MEKLPVKRLQSMQSVLGERALAICASCPLAQVCQAVAVEKCEFIDEGSGDATPVMPEPERFDREQPSYRTLLLDDATPLVMARPLQQLNQVSRAPITAPRPSIKKKTLTPPPQVKKPAVKRRGPTAIERTGEAIADIFASFIGVRGVAKAAQQRHERTP